jgi:hypothetical protein
MWADVVARARAIIVEAGVEGRKMSRKKKSADLCSRATLNIIIS